MDGDQNWMLTGNQLEPFSECQRTDSRAKRQQAFRLNGRCDGNRRSVLT
jgi:hypothetical protein